MEWIAILALAAIAFFVYNGFRTRCPSCGAYSLHPKDHEAEKEQGKHYENLKKTGLGDALDNMGSSLGSSGNKPGYSNAHFKCKSCGHSFYRKEAVIWLTTANKLGEETAIKEYRKLRSE